MKYESLVIWGRQQCNGAKARQKKSIHLNAVGRSCIACRHTQDGSTRLLFSFHWLPVCHIPHTSVYRILPDRLWHTSSSLFNPSWWLIHNLFKRKTKGDEMKGGIFLFLLYFFFSHFVFLLPACCLPSKRSSNTKTSTVSTCETSQNFILPLEINPWKTKTKWNTCFFFLFSYSFFFF